MKRLKLFLAATLTLSIMFFSCSKDSNGNNNDGGGSVTTINLQNSTYTGTALVTFADGSNATGNFKSGTMKLPLQGAKIIAGIQPENQNYILLGRKQGGIIDLNYNNGQLQFRIPINGVIPIGSYAEFRLINTKLNSSYKLEADLDFMNLEWTPIKGPRPFAVNELNFDGQNHEISNLKISKADIFFPWDCRRTYSSGGGPIGPTYSTWDLYVTGLFATINSLKNLIIRSGNITAISTKWDESFTGAFVGYGGSIENCINYANVQGDEPPHDNYDCMPADSDYTGGIAGFNYEGQIKNCINYGTITNGCGICTYGGGVEDVSLFRGDNGGKNGNINYGKTSGCP